MLKFYSGFITILLFCGVMKMSAQAVPAYVPAEGLVGWWPFNGNANDESDNQNHGTVYGATLTTDRNGNEAAAYYFNGMNNYIQVPDSPSLVMLEDLTLAAWVYDEGPSNGQHYHSVISKRYLGYLSYNMGLSFYYDQFGSPTEVQKMYTGTGNALSGFYYRYSGDTIDVNAWQHLAISIRNDTVTFYKNGADMGHNQYGNIMFHDIENQDIGVIFGKIHQNGEFMKGKIDDIGIWNRALSQQEIAGLYNGVNSGAGQPDDDDAIAIYPNPVTETLHFLLPDNNEADLKIFDTAGNLVFSQHLTSDASTIDFSRAPGGIYIAQIISKYRSVAEKIVKN